MSAAGAFRSSRLAKPDPAPVRRLIANDDGVEWREIGHDQEERRRDHRQDGQDDGQVDQSAVGTRQATAEVPGQRRQAASSRLHGRRPARRGRAGGGDLGRLGVEDDEARFGRIRLGEQLDRAIRVDPCERDCRVSALAGDIAGLDGRGWWPGDELAAGQLEPAASLAVERGRDKARRGKRGRRERDGVAEEGLDPSAQLAVEHPDDDADVRVQVVGGQRSLQVAQVVVAGQDDGNGRLDPGLTQDPLPTTVADDHPDVRQPLRVELVIGAVGDRGHRLVAEQELLNRPQPEMAEPADHHLVPGLGVVRRGRVPGLGHLPSLRSGWAVASASANCRTRRRLDFPGSDGHE